MLSLGNIHDSRQRLLQIGGKGSTFFLFHKYYFQYYAQKYIYISSVKMGDTICLCRRRRFARASSHNARYVPLQAATQPRTEFSGIFASA